MTREVIFLPAWDKRHPDPKKDYGVHGVEIVFLLKGEHGAVQFVLHTKWMLPEVGGPPLRPSAVDLGYYSPVSRYEGQQVCDEDCFAIGGPCYYDGSSLNADPVFDALLREGGDGVWKRLEAYYAGTFREEAAA